MTRVRVRLLLLGLSTSLAVAAVASRLSYLTIVAKEEYESRGLVQYQQRLKLDARRGTIHDRNGRALAESVEVDSLYADVAIDRWQRFTGQRAILDGSGTPFPKEPPAVREQMK